MADTGLIYHVFNTVNGKSYVGQTWQDLAQRWKEHCDPSSGCRALRAAVHKHGPDVFVLTQLTACSTQCELDESEAHLGRPLSAKTRLRMSEAHKARWARMKAA